MASISYRLAAVCALALVPGLVLVAADANRRLEGGRQAAIENLADQASALASGYRALSEESSTYLRTLAAMPEIQGYQKNPEACSRFLAKIDAVAPQYVFQGVVSLSGIVACYSRPLRHRADADDRPWFRRVIEREKFSIGDYALGRQSGVPVVHLAYPVKDAAGRLIGAISTAWTLEDLAQRLSSRDFQPRQVLVVTDPSGNVLAEKGLPGSVGKPAPWLASLPAAADGTARVDLNGVPMLVAYVGKAQMDGLGFYLLAEEREVLRAVRESVNRDVALWLSVLIAGFLITYALAARWVAAPLTALRQAASRIAEGDMASEPTALADDRTEIGALAASLRTMSQAIVQREEEHRVLLDDVHEARRAAEQANAAKSRFLAAASHDLRQPLAALSLYAGTLDAKLPPTEKRLAQNIKDCVRSLSDLLSRLLDLSRLQAGVVQPNVQDFSVDDLLRSIVSAFGPAARQKGLSLRCPTTALFVRTDPILVQRMLNNLVANAIRYTERGGVLICVRRREGRVRVEVWDTGTGIPPDRTEEVFEEFKQLNNPARNGAQGAGIGLAVVSKTAALLGLRIGVRSRVGRGSLFFVELPPGEPRSAEAPCRVSGTPLRIAIVEDEATVADALATSLRAVGHHVVLASSSFESLHRLGGMAPDVLISDYRLVGETGLEVVSLLRARFGVDLPAVIITGDTQPETIREISSYGIAVEYKPLDLNTLLGRIAAQGEVRARTPAAVLA